MATDRTGGFVWRVNITSATVPDGYGVTSVLGLAPGDVFADAGYYWRRLSADVRRRKGRPRIMRRINKRSRASLNTHKKVWNAAIRPIRAAVEKVFGTAKSSYGLARARWRDVAKTSVQIHLAFTVCNLRRATLMRTASAP